MEVASTERLYLEDSHLIAGTAMVVQVTPQDDRLAVILNCTVFYPQGGGQPADHGQIKGLSGTFMVTDVRQVNDVIYHYGNIEQGSLSAGDQITMSVDAPTRELNRKLHSAGHLIDVAVQQLQLPLVPGKGYHFPAGPYVEYSGEIAPENREQAQLQIQEKINDLLKTGFETQVQYVDRSKLMEICGLPPNFVPGDKPTVRLVTLVPGVICPCGGTHIKSSQELSKVAVTKIKSKGGITRVSYLLENQCA